MITRPRVRALTFAVVGAAIGVALAARTTGRVGPFECTAVARPSLTSATTLRLAPLGTIELDTHAGPVAIELRVDELRAEEAEVIAANPDILRSLGDELSDDARDLLEQLALRTVLAAAVGGALGALAARASVRWGLGGAGLGALVAGVTVAVTWVSFRPEAVAEPRYTGLLTVAPQAVGDVEALVERFDDHSAQLSDLVANVATIYRAAEGLPATRPPVDAIRVLHVSDIHNNPQGFDLARQLVEQFDVDAVVDTGDITDWGTELEARLLRAVGRFEVPYVFVRGNHDSLTVQTAIADEGAIVLDGDVVEVAGLRMWGAGDPRFTPDQRTTDAAHEERVDEFAEEIARNLRRVRADVDVVVLHDPRAAAGLDEGVPLVLAGHVHEPREARIGEAVLLVEGSTGGAGLRGLQGEEPEPLAASVLYFDEDSKLLVAYDRVSVDSFGRTAVRIQRHAVGATLEALGSDD